MTIEFDPPKDEANVRKHGVSLTEGDGVLLDALALTVEDAAAEGEQRWQTIGLNSFGELMIVVWTHRGQSIRLTRYAGRSPRSGAPMKKPVDFSRGRRGAVVPPRGKTRITIHLDDAIIERFKALSARTGKGYQTLINEALASYGAGDAITAAQVRKIVREELAAKR